MLAALDTVNGKAADVRRHFVSRNNTYVIFKDANGDELHRVMHEGGSRASPMTADTILGAMRAVLAGAKKPRADFALLRHLYDSKDAHVRRDAIRFMGDFADAAPEAVPLLVGALNERTGRFSAAYTAARSLERMGTAAKDAIPMLTTMARESGVGNLNQQSLIALGAIDPDGGTVLPVLIEALTRDDHYARIGAALALRKMRVSGARIVPALVKALETSTARSARYYLVRAIPTGDSHAKAARAVLRTLAANTDVPRSPQGDVVWDVEREARAALTAIDRANR